MELKLKSLISDTIQELFGVSGVVFSVEHPKELSHGDYATNVALVVGKMQDKNPVEVAGSLAQYLNENKPDDVESVTVASPGFVNFTLTQSHFTEILGKALKQKEDWGKNELFTSKKILVEHSSPNLFKPFHIGHVMNNTIGEAIVRLAKFSGADVTAMSYPSDVSLGIGKAIWVLLQDGKEKLENLSTVKEKLEYLGECYVRGTRAYDEDENVQSQVREITKKLYEKIAGTELEVYETAKEINMDYFLAIIARLGSHFDAFIYESEAGVVGEKIVRENTPGIFEESEGAIIYKGEQDGLHTRVFINKEGYPTYEAKDIGLLYIKFDRFDPDVSIFITDNQQASYFEVVLAAASKINSEWGEKSVHRTHGRMSFKGQKMSSRLGGVPTAQDTLDALIDEIKDRSPELPFGAQEKIAVAALKFVVLRAMAGKDINFDPDTSLSFEGDSGPYLQYTTVRAGSILEKAKGVGVGAELGVGVVSDAQPLERLITRFPDVVVHATEEWAPHYVVTYLCELAQTFNTWYGNTKIFDESDPLTPHRLAITEALQQTIKNGLWLLGISTPEKM